LAIVYNKIFHCDRKEVQWNALKNCKESEHVDCQQLIVALTCKPQATIFSNVQICLSILSNEFMQTDYNDNYEHLQRSSMGTNNILKNLIFFIILISTHYSFVLEWIQWQMTILIGIIVAPPTCIISYNIIMYHNCMVPYLSMIRFKMLKWYPDGTMEVANCWITNPMVYIFSYFDT